MTCGRRGFEKNPNSFYCDENPVKNAKETKRSINSKRNGRTGV